MNDEIKICPRCGARLFADMDVCYGCLFDFRSMDAVEVDPQYLQQQGKNPMETGAGQAVQEKPYINLGDRRPSSKTAQPQGLKEEAGAMSGPVLKTNQSLSMNMDVAGDVNIITLSIPKDHMEGFKLSQPIMLRICGEDCMGRLEMEIHKG